ncbi:MAG: sulfite exporter TauE/SafE family protein [Pirellula sp.]|nr:sulfite exporter TauE/SafE family protein [Pirellula sp.]
MSSWGNAFELLGATAIASALGSLHCVGMCGPFAIMASGLKNPDGQADLKVKINAIQQMAAYHIGRLTTYLMMGLAVGFLASSLGRWDWFQSIGVWAGIVLIGMGVWRLLIALSPDGFLISGSTAKHGKWVQAWSMQLARFRHLLPRQTRWQNAFGWGLTTTLLPCGWLYVFVVTAAASTSTAMAMATMIAFWIGTLPLLSISVWGWRFMGDRWRGATGVVSSLCVLTMGVYLMVARSTVELPIPASLLNQASATEQTESEMHATSSVEFAGSEIGSETGIERLNRLRTLLNAGLPCCQADTNDGGN